MPHGFLCDRCEGFVEQDLRGFESHEALRGDSLEIVRIDNPRLQSDPPSSGDIETYTLCEGCRTYLIGEVQSGPEVDA